MSTGQRAGRGRSDEGEALVRDEVTERAQLVPDELADDVLGTGYTARTIPLPDDDEGEVVATLVHHRPTGTPTGDAVLYLHGFSDYFFQTELADFHTARGSDFFALDLRKYGRSLREHQTPGYITDLRDYFAELDEAVRIIRAEYGARRVMLNAHSTGGLIAAIWAHWVRERGLVDAVVLNSPWLDMQGSWLVRTPGTEALDVIGKLKPSAVVRANEAGVYGYSLHHEQHGEWDFDTVWKPLGGFPVRAGWFRAVRRAHRWVHYGLDIRCPVLVMCSTGSRFPRSWNEEAQRFDTVLDADQIARWSPKLGRHVTLLRIEGGMHDLVLSAKPVRERVYAETARWLDAYLPS
jgi:alpha-beta hydrolase superfamily lysophospholipase